MSGFWRGLMSAKEPDEMRGKFDKRQAFRGTISQLNMWDHTLSAEQIRGLADCSQADQGNVVAWQADMFTMINVTADPVNTTDFCLPNIQQFLFPQKMSRSSAVTLCQNHGGFLYTPKSEEQNKKLLEMAHPFKDVCEAKLHNIGFYVNYHNLLQYF